MSRKPILQNQDGALLIGLIVTMVIIAIAGAAAMQLTSGSSFTELFQNNNLKAFYLAESGARYAAPLCNAELQSDPSTTCPDLNNKTFTLSPGQFALTTSNTNTTYLSLTSVGTVNPGSWSQTKRTVTYELVKPFNTPFNDPNNFNQYWNNPTGNALIVTNNGPANGAALEFKGTPVSISLNWYRVPPAASYPDLLAQWLSQGNLLSYDLQVKCKDIPNNSNDSYMLGLLFRLDNTTHKSYGISFYRRKTSGAPGWPATLSSGGFAPLGTGKTYLVLWKETLISSITPTFTLLAYKEMVPPITDVTTAPNYLTDWATIMVSVTEQAGGNLIKGYVVDNNTYPKGTVNWDNMTASTLVTWNTTTDWVENADLTSANFDNRLPAEIGFVGYNGGGTGNNASNKLFFADFAMRFPNDTGLNGTNGTNGTYVTYGTYVQYY